VSYKAIVTKIQVRPHPNADRLQIGSCCGSQVIVGMETKNGDLGVFFPVDGQLSEEFCQANDLVARYDETGKKIGGQFFDEKRRVKAQSFRGVKSEGYWVPISYFDFVGPLDAQLIEGDVFSELLSLDGSKSTPICNKYMTPQTLLAKNSKSHQKMGRRKVDMPEHYDTENVRHHIHELREGDLITITRKLHGTSGRLGFIEVTRPAPNTRWNRIRAFFGRPAPAVAYYEQVIGTRRTVLFDDSNGYYGREQFRRDVVRGIALDKGEILYFEIVGYTENNRLVMQEQPIKDKGLQEVFGKTMRYSYGCEPGQCKLFVYRITRTDVNGNHIELPWEQVKHRCRQLGLEHVPEAEERFFFRATSKHDTIMAMLDEMVNGPPIHKDSITPMPEPLDPRHIQEGIVIRVDNDNGTKFFKLKSWLFLFLEGHIKDDDKYVDMEEAS
jgi:hypothetical protein